MLGAIIGDIVGSIYEFDNIKTKDFDFFNEDCMFTDDTVLTLATANALRKWNRQDGIVRFKEMLIDEFHKFGAVYPDCGFGGYFYQWVRRKKRTPYGSYGNGSAMRVSQVGWFANSMEEVVELAKASAEITHNHPEGIKGAVATTVAIYLARIGKTKEEIKEYITDNYYVIDFTLDDIRPTYDFNESCQGTVPQALEAFFESNSFEDAIRNAISVGGDSDTLAAITGGIAEAYYGIEDDMKEMALSYLDNDLLKVYNRCKMETSK